MARRESFFWRLCNWLGKQMRPTRAPARSKTGRKRNISPTVIRTSKSRPLSPGKRPAGLEASCRSVTSVKDDPWPARVRDLSSGSIGLVLTRRFEPGTLLVIELENKEQSLNHTLVGRVVRATAQNSGAWMLGCTLANRIAEDDLEALLV